jgi:Holliday junction resolvase RusA-like endonuclease
MESMGHRGVIKARECEIGSSSDWNPEINGGHPYRCDFQIPMLPPTVNHYIQHPAAGVHVKSKAAKAFGDQFPIFARDLYVMSASGKFAVTLEYWPGPGDRGDVDNYNKLPLDCAAKRGMLRNKRNEAVSDAWIKRLTVVIHDEADDRTKGPKTVMTIEAMP